MPQHLHGHREGLHPLRRPAAQRERIQRHIERWRAHLASGDPELEAEALNLLKAAVEESAT